MKTVAALVCAVGMVATFGLSRANASADAADLSTSDAGHPHVAMSDGGHPHMVMSDGGHPHVASSDGGHPHPVH